MAREEARIETEDSLKTWETPESLPFRGSFRRPSIVPETVGERHALNEDCPNPERRLPKYNNMWDGAVGACRFLGFIWSFHAPNLQCAVDLSEKIEKSQMKQLQYQKSQICRSNNTPSPKPKLP